MNDWYVIQTKPMSEDRVCGQFARLSSTERSGVIASESEAISCDAPETFCPKIKCMSLSKGEKVKYKALFPSYVFLKWDLSEPANHHLVKYTRGVNKVLGECGKAVPISSEIVDLIKGRVSEGGIIEQKMFKTGDLVKVKRGYLKELIGVLERPVSDDGRVAVLLQLFNRQLSVKMHCGEIAKA